MFMIIPESKPVATEQSDVKAPEEMRSRVRKACNRCRAKKVRCNGRLPCIRCERDGVVCRIERGPLDKELSKSYIAALEGQQLSFLKAVRDLQARFPNDDKVNRILQQLQDSGFDTGPLLPPVQSRQILTTDDKIPSWNVTAESPFSVSNTSNDGLSPSIDLSYLEAMKAQDDSTDLKSMSETLWGYESASTDPKAAHGRQTNSSYHAP